MEDNEEQRRELIRFLEQALYETVTPEGDRDIPDQIRTAHPDLVLMDICLPGTSGLELCRKIRQDQQVPVIFLTGRASSMDELNGMLSGADDYIVKPYCAPVLLARIAAVLKRCAPSGEHAGAEHSAFRTCGEVTLDLLDGTLSFRENKTELTRTEQKICGRLFENAGRIVSREELLDELWDSQIFIDDNTLSVNIARIRKKLLEIGAGEMIRTRRGQGYQI